MGNVCDGLKTSQRKIIYACIEENITKPQKVSELGGIVSAKTAYHHGDTSMTGTIIGMSQDFWSANNIALLYGKGNFGNRKEGDNASSPRYISSYLHPISKLLFHKDDLPLYDYIEEDNKRIEPEFYVPILPVVLINGLDGIGTGFSCQIPKYNPTDIVNRITDLMKGKSITKHSLVPWYRHFKGKIELTDTVKHQYTSTGTMERTGLKSVHISELPIGKFGSWTEPYKNFIESCVTGYAEAVKSTTVVKKTATIGASATAKSRKNKEEFLHSFLDNSSDKLVDITIEFEDSKYLDSLIESGEIYKKLKLQDTINISNMHLFDTNGKIHKYSCPEEIILEFYHTRLALYKTRKEYMMHKYKSELVLISSKVRFITEILYGYDHLNESKGTALESDLEIKNAKGIVIFRKKRKEIDNILDLRGYPKNHSSESGGTSSGSYSYLLSMHIQTFSHEKINELLHERDSKQFQIDTLASKGIKDLWKDDLSNFTEEYRVLLTTEN